MFYLYELQLQVVIIVIIWRCLSELAKINYITKFRIVAIRMKLCSDLCKKRLFIKKKQMLGTPIDKVFFKSAKDPTLGLH